MKKLTKAQVESRLSMYDEAINYLDEYEGASPELNRHEQEQKLVVIRQLKALADRFFERFEKSEVIDEITNQQ
jgi:hypothetical protein